MTLFPFLADHVKESTNGAIVQNDNQGNQNCVNGTHKDKVNRVAYPVKNKWKHGNVLPIVDLALFLAERSADTDT